MDLLEYRQQEEDAVIDRDRWVAVMRAAGFSDADMHNWHRQFERMEPEGHEEFLRLLGCDDGEVERIRQWSQSSA